MTEYNRKPLSFSSIYRRRVQADFDDGRLTSDAGGRLLREVDRRLGLIDRPADCLTDPHDPAKIQHDQRTMPAQRIYGIALDKGDLNDHDELRHVPRFRVMAEKAPEIDGGLARSAGCCRRARLSAIDPARSQTRIRAKGRTI